MDERNRQKSHREKLAEDPEVSQVPERNPASSSEGAMSLAGDILVPAEIIEKILVNWDKMSLAGVDPQVLESIREIGRKVRQMGQETPDVTDRRYSVSDRNDR